MKTIAKSCIVQQTLIMDHIVNMRGRYLRTAQELEQIKLNEQIKLLDLSANYLSVDCMSTILDMLKSYPELSIDLSMNCLAFQDFTSHSRMEEIMRFVVCFYVFVRK